jgi:hypothetical protein
MIRPYPVLQQTLVELKNRWREKVSYDWICNQFKSLRQDLTVRVLSIGRFCIDTAPSLLLGAANKKRIYRSGL